MALKVWMPLNGNLRNLGASVLTATNYGATVNANGKIGPCYQFNNTNITLSPTAEFNNSFSSEGTLALWIKLNSNHSGYAQVLTYGLESTSWNGILFGIDINGSGIPIFNCSNSNSYINCSLGISIKDNSWHHLAATYQSNQLKIYLDGILKNTVTTTIIPNWASCSVIAIGGNSSEKLANNDCLNDIRIYNHCLSAMEVRKIAKGLTLHYKLDECDNLLQLQPRAYNPGIYQAYQLQLIENLQSGQTYTFQFWDVDVAHSGKTESGLGIAVYWGGGNVALKTMNGTSYFTNGHADYLEFTTTISSTQASGVGATNPWLCIYNSVGDAAGTKYMYIGKWQVTKGSTIRPWTRTITSDIIDSSGYNNNASSNGTLRVGNSVSTPRYTCSAWFDTGARITTPVSAHTFLPTDAITVNIWCKTSDVSQRFLSCTEGGGWNFEVSGGVLTFPIYIASVGYQICSFTTPLSTMNDNQWHMYTATYNRSQIKVYFDGVLDNTLNVSTGNSIQYQTYTPLCLGTEARHTDINEQVAGTFVGALSDLRIYCTPLSDGDIKELYYMGMKIDKGQNIHAYEFKEISNSDIKLYKTGILQNIEFNETTTAAFKKTKKITASQFIEE